MGGRRVTTGSSISPHASMALNSRMRENSERRSRVSAESSKIVPVRSRKARCVPRSKGRAGVYHRLCLFAPQGNVSNRRVCEQMISHYQHIITTVSLVKTLRDDLAIGRFERVVHVVCHHQTERAHQPWGITLEGDGANALCP